MEGEDVRENILGNDDDIVEDHVLPIVPPPAPPLRTRKSDGGWCVHRAVEAREKKLDKQKKKRRAEKKESVNRLQKEKKKRLHEREKAKLSVAKEKHGRESAELKVCIFIDTLSVLVFAN